MHNNDILVAYGNVWILHIYCGFNFYPVNGGLWFVVFNATFNNISAISWRFVLLVEETGVIGENHRPVASHWQTLSHTVVSSTPRHVWTHNTDCTSTRTNVMLEMYSFVHLVQIMFFIYLSERRTCVKFNPSILRFSLIIKYISSSM
jgi:hypothetical protein